jgi:hypothetical protein
VHLNEAECPAAAIAFISSPNLASPNQLLALRNRRALSGIAARDPLHFKEAEFLTDKVAIQDDVVLMLFVFC